jgi:hypothetical protein
VTVEDNEQGVEEGTVMYILNLEPIFSWKTGHYPDYSLWKSFS